MGHAVIVQFDKTRIKLTSSGEVATIRWETITRVCYNVQAMPWAIEDEIFVFTSERSEHYEISMEDTGAESLWEEILRRGLFDAKLAIDMKKLDGVFCWPPTTQETGSSTLRTRIALVQAILGHSGLNDAVGVLQKQASLPGTPVSATADEAIDAILADAQNTKRHAQVLVDPLINELLDPSSMIREEAANAIATVICFGGHSAALIGTLENILLAADPSSKLAENLALAFWQAALRELDLRPAVKTLEQAQASPNSMTRSAASHALSIYFQKVGVEPPIMPIKNLKLPTFKPGGDWNIQVRYRRTHALTDDPVLNDYPHYPCAACGSDDTLCLWDEQTSEPFVSVDGEVLCRKCGRYSIYEYRNLKK